MLDHVFVYRLRLPLALLITALYVLFAGLFEAHAYQPEYTTIKVCNTGNVELLVGVVKANRNLIAPNEWRGDGWYDVNPGRCKYVHGHDSPGTYYLTFMQYDSKGNPGIALYRPGRVDGKVKDSDWSFCVKVNNFEYEESGKPTQDCPTPWFLAPFPYSIWQLSGQNELTIDIPASSSASLISIPGRNQTREAPEEPKPDPVPAAPPPPPSPPPPPPKPGWLGITVLDTTPMTEYIGSMIGAMNNDTEGGRDRSAKLIGGLLITSVTEDSPASQAGILAGDRIDQLWVPNCLSSSRPKDIKELRACLKELQSDWFVVLYVLRGKERVGLVLHTQEKPVKEAGASSALTNTEESNDFTAQF